MKELNDLLAALEACYSDETNEAEITANLWANYRAYKAATPPLVLEAVDCGQVVSLIPVTNGYSVGYMGKCYRLPNGGNDERTE